MLFMHSQFPLAFLSFSFSPAEPYAIINLKRFSSSEPDFVVKVTC